MNIKPVYNAIDVCVDRWDTIEYHCVLAENDVWIEFSPLTDLFGWFALTGLRSRSQEITFNYKGKFHKKEFVRRSDFLGEKLLSRRNPDFRDFIVEFTEMLKDQGQVVSPEFEHDPIVQLCHGVAQTRIDLLRTQERVDVLANGQKALEDRTGEIERSVAVADRKADRALSAANAVPGWYTLVPWAKTRGIHLDPQIEGKKEGTILSAECRRRGIKLGKYPMPNFPEGVNTYPEEMLVWWLQDYNMRRGSGKSGMDR